MATAGPLVIRNAITAEVAHSSSFPKLSAQGSKGLQILKNLFNPKYQKELDGLSHNRGPAPDELPKDYHEYQPQYVYAYPKSFLILPRSCSFWGFTLKNAESKSRELALKHLPSDSKNEEIDNVAAYFKEMYGYATKVILRRVEHIFEPLITEYNLEFEGKHVNNPRDHKKKFESENPGFEDCKAVIDIYWIRTSELNMASHSYHMRIMLGWWLAPDDEYHHAFKPGNGKVPQDPFVAMLKASINNKRGIWQRESTSLTGLTFKKSFSSDARRMDGKKLSRKEREAKIFNFRNDVQGWGQSKHLSFLQERNFDIPQIPGWCVPEGFFPSIVRAKNINVSTVS
jgi:hypothetical protein